ncbi:chaperonin 10-like protein [Aspergillus pseudotamarii]|uniref:Chaperonin 10-like protein n=1 Tax=Aspergillus pseudotamarii TaxID=132259 RepID=A0A5N6SB14_ASPPS|nr:chaperonin 10-like protein [Aspergillus pseudotamarii]KAE8130880.1 chaperonin 10-like protein [Aspergillus pseudotamarii]
MSNKAAILIQTHGPLVIKDLPIPQCAPTEVIVKVKAVATNAADWKVYEGHFPQDLPIILGCDIVGEISEVGPRVTGFNVGDKVAGYTQQQLTGMQSMMSTGRVASDLRHGGYQTYVPMLPRMIFKVPDSIPDEVATTFGCSFFTAATAVFRSLDFPYPIPSSAPAGREKVLVWGGASAVGAFAIQLLKASHAEVTAVCSAKNFDYVRSLGASHVIDYGASDVVEQVKAQGLRFRVAFDAISSQETCNACLDIVGEGGKVANVQFLEALRRPNIDLVHTNVVEILGESDAEFLSSLIGVWTPKAVSEGTLKGVQFTKYSGGLSAIDRAIQDHRDGKIAGKGVVRGI